MCVAIPTYILWNPQRSDSDKMEVENLKDITTYGGPRDDHDVYAVFFHIYACLQILRLHRSLSPKCVACTIEVTKWVRTPCWPQTSSHLPLLGRDHPSQLLWFWYILIYTAQPFEEFEDVSPLKTDDFPASHVSFRGVNSSETLLRRPLLVERQLQWGWLKKLSFFSGNKESTNPWNTANGNISFWTQKLGVHVSLSPALSYITFAPLTPEKKKENNFNQGNQVKLLNI